MKSITVSFPVLEGKKPPYVQDHSIQEYMRLSQCSKAKQNIYLLIMRNRKKRRKEKAHIGMETAVFRLDCCYEIMVICGKFRFWSVLSFSQGNKSKSLLQLSLCKGPSLHSVCFGRGSYFIVSFAKMSLGFSRFKWCSHSWY